MLRLTLLGSLSALAGSFSTAPLASRAAPVTSRAAASPRCAEEGLGRRLVLNTAIGAAVGTAALPAWAGYVTSLGIETMKKSDADIDTDLLASTPVQTSIKSLQRYQKVAKFLQGKFEENTNVVIIPFIRKEFDFSKVRADLNTVTAVFDDETQKTIDRITRSILYDLSELENSSRFKDGETTRTPKKIANVEKWFTKLDADITSILSYLT